MRHEKRKKKKKKRKRGLNAGYDLPNQFSLKGFSLQAKTI
jgi:hypothetical protein